MATASLQPTDMAGWAPGTRHYTTSDGKHFAVEAPEEAVPDGAKRFVGELLAVAGADPDRTTVVLRPTVILPCNPDGSAYDLTPVHEFPPGTSCEDALKQAGYEVTEPGA